MTVEDFLERQKKQGGPKALGFLMDIMELLDYFDDETCAVLAGKIRGHLAKAVNRAKK